ncbi:hypothetical protein HPG69_003472 [Diceros bicornis minor]|uniref:Uncharacterized protein n=1 Tax=Diceros bicornis minor TaxID=77932 RepID=A0A7J7EA01_DICBM|nr:hypothetical protein HPG69_003472 [Diceros bicornis minor]
MNIVIYCIKISASVDMHRKCSCAGTGCTWTSGSSEKSNYESCSQGMLVSMVLFSTPTTSSRLKFFIPAVKSSSPGNGNELSI